MRHLPLLVVCCFSVSVSLLSTALYVELSKGHPPDEMVSLRMAREQDREKLIHSYRSGLLSRDAAVDEWMSLNSRFPEVSPELYDCVPGEDLRGRIAYLLDSR